MNVAVEDLGAPEPGAITDGPFGSNLKTSHYTSAGPGVIRLQNIGDGEFVGPPAHISDEHFATLGRHEARAGDVVVAMLGETLPRACLVPERLGPAIVKADCARIRIDPKLALPRFVAFGLNSDPVRRQASKLVHGVGRPRLGLGLLRDLSLSLAPLPEQHRIVEALESHFTRLDATVATLERVQRNLKRYRASVLKSAVEGRLVPTEAELARAEGRDYEPASVLLERILAERRRRWEESKKRGKYAEPKQADAEGLPELQEGWCWATLDQLTSGDRKSAYGVLVPGPDVADGVPFVRVGDIRDGLVNDEDLKRISRSIADRFSKTYLQGGEVLITLVGTIGRTAVVPDHLSGANVARAVGVVPTGALVSARWVEIWFRSPLQRQSLESKAHEVARKTLNLEDVRAALVALPPLAEQARIHAAVDDLDSRAIAVNQAVGSGLDRCVRLRQSILKWAFEGKLADQDPSDEPASALLERIRHERAAAEKATQADRVGKLGGNRSRTPERAGPRAQRKVAGR